MASSQPTLELAAVHESRERIVRRLVRHLAREAAQLGDVVQQHDCAGHLLVGIADRRGRQLDRALAAVRLRQQQRAAAEIHGRAGRERLAHRIGEQPPVRFVDETDDVLERLADGCRVGACELLGGRIDIGDGPAVSVAMIASASESSASECMADRLRWRLASGGRRNCCTVWVGMISTPVMSSAGAPS